MKRLFLVLALAGVCLVDASAQKKVPETVNLLPNSNRRIEIILPQVNGLNVYKADLHSHSIYSDAELTPEQRVKEAWLDGLDIFSMTDHIEVRRHEPNMLKFLKGYTGGEALKAENNSIHYKAGTDRGILVDLNLPTQLAQKSAKGYGESMLIIPGCEITRNPLTIGHYNALFTTDNNAIYDPDPIQSFRNAKAQGALIQHNHPGWRRTSVGMTDFEKQAYAEGLIDGIEIMNGGDFYPVAIERATELGLFMSANTDIHGTTAMDYGNVEVGRNMTLIFAKEKTLPAMREAIEAHRTLAYAFGNLAGDELLLKDFFLAAVKFNVIARDSKNVATYSVTNTTSLPLAFRVGSSNVVWLDPFSTLNYKGNKVKFTVENMWYGVDKHPVIEVEF